MKDIIIVWIAAQLIVIGVSLADIHNKILDKTLECKTGQISKIMSATMPLVFFLPRNQEVINYCNNQKAGVVR